MIRYISVFIAALALVAVVATSSFSLDFSSLADQSSLRCSTNVVAVGDIDRTVRETCGDPIRILRVQDLGPIWVYGNDQDRFMYYLEFMNGKLQRIVSAPCRLDDPACFDLR